MSSVDTVCPVCWESVHGDTPVGVLTGCGHVMHQCCYRDWQKRGEYTYEASSGSRRNYNLNFHLNCLICNQPTKSFVDLFIRLPAATQDHKEAVGKLEHEFNTVCRRTQLSLEKEIARRDFEQTWLQEERQLSVAARQRTEQRHKQVIREMHRNLKSLKKDYQRKISSMEERRKRKSNESMAQNGRSVENSEANDDGQEEISLVSPESSTEFSVEPTEDFQESIEENEAEAGTVVQAPATNMQVERLNFNVPSAAAAAVTPSEQSVGDQFNTSSGEGRHLLVDTLGPDNSPYRGHCQYAQFKTGIEGNQDDQSQIQPAIPGRTLDFSSEVQENESNIANMGRVNLSNVVASNTVAASSPLRQVSLSPAQRARRVVPRDVIFHPDDVSSSPATPTRGRRSVLRDEIFVPESLLTSAEAQVSDTETMDASVADGSEHLALESRSGSSGHTTVSEYSSLRKQSSSVGCDDDRKQSESPVSSQLDESETSLINSDYEVQRLQADSAFYQHQAELVEWERHQTEIELEQDEIALRQREQRIRMERSRLEQSFTFIQRRVRESKREARDRQKLSALEEKYAKYKLARRREEERYEQELHHLEQDEVHIREREQWEKERQDKEKARLKKELNELLKVKKRLERERELAKQAEERSLVSQGNETCVVCFESLVNDESELGVAVPCGHAFHCSCFNGWEKSKRKRSTSSVPCPLCNHPTNLCVSIRLNRPHCSLYCASASLPALTKHFQKQELRWQRRRLANPEGEFS